MAMAMVTSAHDTHLPLDSTSPFGIDPKALGFEVSAGLRVPGHTPSFDRVFPGLQSLGREIFARFPTVVFTLQRDNLSSGCSNNLFLLLPCVP
jgi:hypothetical protein